MSGYKIVCVDDEQDILDYLETILAEYGYESVNFTDPSQAFDYVLENKKNILMICSDFKMPEMTGFQLRSKLLENSLDHPFVIVTGFFDKELAVDAMRLNISEFISKPIVENDFKPIILNYAEKRKASIEEDREMVCDFLEETYPMLDEIEELILELEENPEDENAINTYFRLLHTIKGTASCIGLDVLAAFAHKYEDLINLVKGKKQKVNSTVINVLLKGSDYLKQMYACEKEFKAFPHKIEDIVKIFDQDFTADNNDAIEDEQKQDVQKSSKSSSVKEEKISISVDILSDFLEMSGELTVLKNTIFKILIKMNSKYNGDPDLEQLSASMAGMHKISSLLQNQVAEMKKITVETVYKPMKRVVRDSANVCNKKVHLNTTGANLRVDTSVGKLLNNVLVHMLRNSVDHGIESPERREEIGKNPEGVIDLNLTETGESIIVEIIDDGNGIDPEKIKEKALEKELYSSSDLEKMSKNRVFQILFESGFSTAEKITAVSGRGVGMDMVKSSIEEFGGRIFIDSELGKGSKFIIDIPIPRSVLIIKSLMVFSKGLPFNIPLDDVEKVVLYEDVKEEEMMQEVEGKLIFRYHDRLIPLLELRDILQLEARDKKDIFNIVIVRSEHFCYGIVVDEIEDIEEVVVKKLSHPLDKAEIFQGVTFVGDGELGLIINVKGIAKTFGISAKEEEEVLGIILECNDEKEYMQFNLLEHKNFCLPLEYVYRLEVVQVSSIEYSGDLPLIKYREGTLPLILPENELGLTDISMVELLEGKEEIDIIVIHHKGHKRGLFINEITDIIKTSEVVDHKMKDDNLILGTIFMSEKTNTVIDIEKMMSRCGPKVIELEVEEAKQDNKEVKDLDNFLKEAS
jgi:two-component system chemotaxis sensor kinase CheA